MSLVPHTLNPRCGLRAAICWYPLFFRISHPAANRGLGAHCDAPDGTDIPAPGKIMIFFAEARTFLKAPLPDEGDMVLEQSKQEYLFLTDSEFGPVMAIDLV